MRQKAAVRVRLQIRRLVRNEHLTLGVLAFAVGIAAAYGALIFRIGVGEIQQVSFGFSLEDIVLEAGGLPWWQIVAVPTIGGLLVGIILQLHGRGRAQGVAHVIEASALQGGRMSLKDGIVSTIVHVMSLGFGASTGREGPVVHLGATLGAWLSQRLSLDRSQSRTLLACGVAAATGSLFNAPVAGAVFAIELIVGNLSLTAGAPIFIAAVTGTAIGRFYFGNAPAFVVPAQELISLWEFPAFALLGVISAAVAIIFMKTIFAVEGAVEKTKMPMWAQPMCGGLLIGVIAVFLPQILGVGYLATDAALRAEFGLQLLLFLIVAKIAAVAICIGFGFGGGVFSPSLFLGAMVGGAFGIIAGGIFPDQFSGVAAYALIGTAALAGAVMGAPLATIFIIFELTGSSTLTVAVMVSTVVASVVIHQFYARSFFHRQLANWGTNLTGGHDQAILRNLLVRNIMRRGYATIEPEGDTHLVHVRIHEAQDGEVYVVGETGGVSGVITYADIEDAVLGREDGAPLDAWAISQPIVDVLLPEDSLESAQAKIAATGRTSLPVVRDRESMELCGVVGELEIARAYNRALLRARAEEHD
ncbi:MAG: chloride channel protein [Alphaproteobacteria bacterium]|nr:chloride channel protein [Alphaproteobacteria bacterium]